MKKSLSIFLVMILSLCLFFTGCENNNINNSSYGVNNTLNNIDNTNQEELNQIENNEQPETIKTQI